MSASRKSNKAHTLNRREWQEAVEERHADYHDDEEEELDNLNRCDDMNDYDGEMTSKRASSTPTLACFAQDAEDNADCIASHQHRSENSWWQRYEIHSRVPLPKMAVKSQAVVKADTFRVRPVELKWIVPNAILHHSPLGPSPRGILIITAPKAKVAALVGFTLDMNSLLATIPIFSWAANLLSKRRTITFEKCVHKWQTF